MPLIAQTPASPLSSRDKRQAASETDQGAKAAAEIAKEAKFITDKTDLDRVNAIGQRIAAVANVTPFPVGYGNEKVFPFTWHFLVIKDKDVNAFSLPGGYVYINSGLLKFVRSDDELAGVLAHEIAHSAHHHIQSLSHEQGRMNSETMAGLLVAVLAHVPAQDIANLLRGTELAQLGIMNSKYSQPAERDADHGGVILMQKAGFNPVGMLTFMRLLSDRENRSPKIDFGILQDHPYTTERVGLIETELAQMNVPVTPRTLRQAAAGPRAAVTPAGAGADEVSLAGHALPTIADPDGTRAQAIARALNDSLDSGLQMYQVKDEGNQLVVSDRPLVTFTSADAALHPGSTPQSLAAEASRAIRAGLWAQSFSAASN